jgi:hypothetical protein
MILDISIKPTKADRIKQGIRHGAVASSALRIAVRSVTKSIRINKANSKIWIVTYMDGTQRRISSLRLFCEENNYSYQKFLKEKKSPKNNIKSIESI